MFAYTVVILILIFFFSFYDLITFYVYLNVYLLWKIYVIVKRRGTVSGQLMIEVLTAF